MYLLTKLIFTSSRGGPAYRLMQWVGVAKGDRAPLKRRIVVLIAVTWIPLLVFAATFEAALTLRGARVATACFHWPDIVWIPVRQEKVSVEKFSIEASGMTGR